MIGPLVSPDVAAGLHATGAAVFADVRWYLDGRDGRAAYEAEHIAGAVFVDLDHDLADHSQPATSGRHPLPTPDRFAAAMAALAIGDDTTVIAYDDSGGGTAGRLVVMLRAIGRNAALLDGGLRSWEGPRATGPSPQPASASFTPADWPTDRFASLDEMRTGTSPMFDARSADRYRGDSEPVDRIGGHIPGAGNAPWAGNLDPATGRFRSAAEIRARFGLAAGDQQQQLDTDLICYCGSGVSACANVLALEHAGVSGARLFVASWSGWSADPANGIETGDDSTRS